MSKSNPISIIEALKRYFESKKSNTAFTSVAPELAELYTNYHNLLKILSNKQNLITDKDLLEKLMAMEFSLRESSYDLIRIIETVIDRKITVHILQHDENILKIAQKYHSDIIELLDLNRIRKMYNLEAETPVLVPTRNL